MLEPSPLFRAIERWRPWQITAISVAASCVIVGLISVVWWGEVRADYIVTGLITSGVVSYLVIRIVDAYQASLRNSRELLQTEIDERIAMQSHLIQSDRLATIGTLAAGVAHEINNPLAFVIGNLDFISEEVVADAQVAEALSDAREGADRVRRIVEDLRLFACPARSDDRPADVDRVLDAALTMLNHEIRERARVVREGPSAGLVAADESDLAQVFSNLLLNAAQSFETDLPEDNLITVRVCPLSDTEIAIEVADSGVGMDAETVAKVFNPFFTTKAPRRGTGLGLSICHGIITSLGGRILIESSVGDGTIVRVVMPSCGPDSGAVPLPGTASVIS